jgi:hypothetical protein
MIEMGTLDHFNLFVASPIVAMMEKNDPEQYEISV